MDNVNVMFAKQATMDHFTATGAADTTRTLSIKSATQQVVSGMLYTITFSTNMNEECTVKVWEQAWMTPQRQITDGPSCVAVQNRRQIAGGVSAATLTMDNVNVMFAKQATMDHFTATGAADTTRTLSIKSATQQVVSGMLYTITFSTNMNEECTVKVWEQVWMTPQRSISSGPNCVAVQNRRQLGGGMPGGVSAADMNSAEVQAALNFGVKAVNGMENSMYLRKVQGSYTVTKQVVSGMLYKFTDVVLAQTDCFKGSNTDLSMCNVSDPADENTCSFTIAVQAWMTPSMKVVDWSC